ncbi:glycosyltransferase family protein [Nodularia harveyana]|nr:hypothetical protein [Nodularia harveyana]
MTSPVVTFIIPLKSPDVSEDYSLVSKLCIGTLNSILSSSCSDVRIILVCNAPPEKYPNDSRLEIISEQFAIPTNRSELFLDQKLKIKRGMIALKGFKSGYVMRMDADDFIHRDLVDFVKKNYNKSHGWYMPKGYVWEIGSKYIFTRNNFHLTTASSHIVYLTENDLPESMNTPDSDYFVDLWEHLLLVKTCNKLNRPLQPIPYRYSIYTIGHSESVMSHSLRNWSSFKKTLWKLISIRPLTRTHVENFGL